MCEPTKPQHVVLTGMMGTGKSTVGALLAKCLHWPMVDIDAWIERSQGQSIHDIFSHFGEPAFRKWEQEAVLRALSEEVSTVIALGGGAVTDPLTRERIAAHFVVWLDARLEVLRERVQEGDRPLVRGQPFERFTSLAEERRQWYAQVSRVRIDTTHQDPKQVAKVIMDWYLRQQEGEARGRNADHREPPSEPK